MDGFVLVTGEARVGTQLLFSAYLDAGLGLVLDYLWTDVYRQYGGYSCNVLSGMAVFESRDNDRANRYTYTNVKQPHGDDGFL